MVSPPRPIMRPTMPWGQSTVSWTSPCWSSLDTSCSIARLAAATYSAVSAVMVIFFVSPPVRWSIWIRVLVEYCNCLIVSPPLPMIFPTMDVGISIKSDAWPEERAAVAATGDTAGAAVGAAAGSAPGATSNPEDRKASRPAPAPSAGCTEHKTFSDKAWRPAMQTKISQE
jgi:hypothetical protein